MPNWCSNVITIIGDVEDVKEVMSFVRNDEEHTLFSLEKIFPTPEDASDLNMIKNGMPDWYHWRIENWGTKWDVDCHSGLKNDFLNGRYYASYAFQSAWSPPIAALTHLASLFPKVFIHIAYDEPGMDFSGIAVWMNGEENHAEEWAMSLSNAVHKSDGLDYFEWYEDDFAVGQDA